MDDNVETTQWEQYLDILAKAANMNVTNMGVDISTYRCRIGSFISWRGADVGRGADDGRGADVGRGADDGRGADIGQGADVGQGSGWMKFFISFCKLIKFIGSLTFIGMLLLMAGIESNPGPIEAPDKTDPLFEKWARVAYGYNYLKAGLTGFISSQIGRRHSELKLNVQNQGDNVKSCSGCTTDTLLPDHGTVGCNQEVGSICLCQQDPCSRKKCPKHFCGRFYHLIVDDHVKNSPRWSSTDPTKWYKDEFQYAKCFLNTDSSANSESDLDCTDLLTIVINNCYIHHSVHEVKSFQQCLEDHNKIFNSSSLEVTDSELNDFFDNMRHVLEDGDCLINDPDAQQAIYELHKLEKDSMRLSDEDIDELLKKASENGFIFRYQILLIEIGTKVLRHLFDERVHSNFRQYLKSEPDADKKLQDLINNKKHKKITAAQAQILPPIDNNPSSSNFDISLLSCLLRNVCGMLPAEHLVWKKPYGNSTEADITRLRQCRNDLSHSGTVFISKTDFDAKWDELCVILQRLNSGLKCGIDLQSSIKDAQNCSLDGKKREDFNKSINDWEKMDGHVPSDVKQLDRLEQNVNTIGNNMQVVMENQNNMHNNQNNIQGLLKTLIAAFLPDMDTNKELTVKIEVTGQTRTASSASQALLLNDANIYVSVKPSQDRCNEVQTACNNFLSAMEDKGGNIIRVEEGSILVTFRCRTLLALKEISLYVTDNMYQEKLTVLENALSKSVMCPVKLNIYIAPEPISSALMQIDKALSKKSVALTLKYRGEKSVRNAVDFLVKESYTDKKDKLSDDLSRTAGEKIELQTTFDKLESDVMEFLDLPSLPDGNIAHKEKQNIYLFRYQYLLIEIGTTVLRAIFDGIVGYDFATYLANNSTASKALTSLMTGKNRKITGDQEKLLPPKAKHPTSSIYDLTLLTCLLRNVCGLSPAGDPVWINPLPTDHSTEADIARLRKCRNKIQHIDTSRLSEKELNDKWQDLVQILNRLNCTAGIGHLSKLMSDARYMDIDEQLKERYHETIISWETIDCLVDKLQEDVAELKRLQTDIPEDVAELERLQSDIQEDVAVVKRGQSDIQQDVAVVKRLQTDIQEDVAEVKHGQTDIPEDVAVVKHGQSDIQQDVAVVKRGQSDIQQDVAEVKHGQSDIQQDVAEVKHGQSDIQQDVAEVKHGQSEIQQDVAEVKHGQSDIQEDVAVVKRGQSDIQQDVAKVKHGQSDIHEDVAEVKRGQTDIPEDVAVVKHGQSDIQEDVAEVKHGQSDIQEDVAEVKHGRSDIQQDVAAVKRGRSDIQEDVVVVKRGRSDIQQDVAVVKRGRSDIPEDVAEVKRGQSYIQQDVAGLNTRVEHVEKTLQGHLTELKDIQKHLVDFYKRSCKTLPVTPLFQNKDENMLSIYKYPMMYSVKCIGEETTEKKEIKCYEDIFCNDDRVFEEIYIVGDAGVGKTYFCTCMSFLWFCAKSEDKLGDKYIELQKDVEYMSKFEFVFYVSLRDTCHTRVEDMIIEQLFRGDEAKYPIIDTILREKKTLILMDGLDEWLPIQGGKKTYELPDRIYSKNCVYVTTTRPYRIESVRLSRKDVGRRIEIKGISGESSMSYIEDVIKYMNTENSDNRNLSDFISDIERYKLNDELCIPIIASYMVILWFEQTLTDMPRALIYANILELLFKRAEKKGVDIPSFTESKFLHLPDSLSGFKYLNKHVSLLYNVCHLSFRSLFKQDENASNLVFTVDQLQDEPYCFTHAETDFLCKIGILSKNEVFGCYSVEKLKISFISKNYMEFFAALFIYSSDISQVFDTRWKLSFVLQSEHLILLLVGFFPEGVKVLFDNLYQLMSDDLSLCRRNAIFHYDSPVTIINPYLKQIKSLQNIVIKCFKEVNRSNDPNFVLKLEDFIFDDNSNVDILRQLLLLNTTCVKSIQSVNGKYYDEFDQIKNLQCLHVGKVLSGEYDVKFTVCMLQNQSTLHTVCIEARDTLITELLVRNLQHLTSVSLSSVTMQHNSLHNLVKFLSDNVLIENVKLSHVSCDNHPWYGRHCSLTLNLPHHTKLTSLYLSDVDILCHNVNNSSLKSITLGTLSERIVRCCIDVFNCIKDSQLEHLVISGSYMLDYNTMKTLMCTVKTLPYIRSLRLRAIELPDDVLLQLHPHVTLVNIVLELVTMSRQCFHCFIESVLNKETVIEVELGWCKITSIDVETNKALSYKESVDYMSEYLTSIPTVIITGKGDAWLDFKTRSCQ